VYLGEKKSLANFVYFEQPFIAIKECLLANVFGVSTSDVTPLSFASFGPIVYQQQKS